MNCRVIVVVGLLLFAAQSVIAQEQATVDPLEAAFQRIVDDLNRNQLDRYVRAVDRDGMLEEIFARRLIDPKVREQFTESFPGQIKTMLTSSFPPAEDEILGRLVSFKRQGESATAVVRFDISPYAYVYREFNLRAGPNDRAIIVDWVDFFTGERLTDAIGDSLAMAMPGDNQTRALLSPLQLNEAEIFQARELFKAIRDRNAKRYFEILPGMDARIRRHELIARTSVLLARQSRDKQNYRSALSNLAENYASEPRYSAMLLDYQLPRRQFEQALMTMQRLKSRLGTEDAALNSQLATLELILGKTDDAARHAEAAIVAEPRSELAWWAVLRTRTAEERFDDAVAALQVLEDEFGHKLRGSALERDAGLAKLLETDQFKAWQAAEKS